MNGENLLNISESARRAAVTEETLKQYVKLGFLKPRTTGDELFFTAEELNALFGANQQSVGGEPKVNAEDRTSDKIKSLEDQIEVTAGPADSFSANNIDQPFVQKNWRFSHFSATQSVDREVLTALMGRVEGETSVASGNDYVSKSFSSNNHELVTLNRRLQEEIRMLKDERDWLRLRLEKLEARAERDQMLLLSESENIRGLVSATGQRRSFWTMALPWFKNMTDSSRSRS